MGDEAAGDDSGNDYAAAAGERVEDGGGGVGRSGEELAERVGFEPTIPVKVCPLSRRIVSTTHAPLRGKTAFGSWLLAFS